MIHLVDEQDNLLSEVDKDDEENEFVNEEVGNERVFDGARLDVTGSFDG